ncbi:peptide transporter [bacterium]|nr:peptide transporter [bacterium]MBU1995084.1 peptide transporter [bacterium]
MLKFGNETNKTLLYILIAFAFSVAVRMIWVYQFSGYEAFMFNGQFMINTNDGYYFAEGARDILSGVNQKNDLSPITSAVSQLTAFFAAILPFSFESVILYMPVFLSSLVVVPIILIAKNLDNLELGFIAALLACIGWSYYNRTMVGYYDTDMLNIVLPMFLLWSIVWAIKTNQDRYLIITALDILIYRWWYPASYALEFSFFALILVYVLVYDRKNLYNYKLLALMMFAMLMVDGYIRVALVLGVFFLLRQERFQKYVYHIFAASVILFLATGGVEPIWFRLKGYVFKDLVSAGAQGLNLHFFTVMQTVREAGSIPFSEFANRISGHVLTFILSLIGFIYLAYRHKIMLFALPMIGLGFLAMVGGLRFTIYAVPVLAFGIAFLITEISLLMPNKKIKYLSMAVLTLAVLFPNIRHVESYKVPTVFSAEEVNTLAQLKQKADREDYVIAWWDYGYPIRYYADVKTLVDGGKHSGEVNFPVSFMLTNPQDVSAKMARLDVEFTERNFKSPKAFTNIEQMSTEYGFDDTNDFLLSLQTQMKLPEKTREIYFYLPFKMLNIYPTVGAFSNIDLMSGKAMKEPFFFMSRNFSDTQDTIELGRGVSINKKDQTLKMGQQIVPIRRFTKTFYDAGMHLKKNTQLMNFNSNISVIYMSNYNTFLVVDEKTYNSLYIQLMVLEEYDASLYEKIIATPHAKVYKLKI